MDIHFKKGLACGGSSALDTGRVVATVIAYDGRMLDGGYLDNLPVMEMKRKGAK